MHMDLAKIYMMYSSSEQKSLNWRHLPVRLDNGSDRNIISPTKSDAAAAPLKLHTENEILHPDISKFGHTTNVLIYSFLDNNRGQQFTREEIRKSLESHKLALSDNGMDEQHLTRIRTGKASVNYWIDRLVENGSLNKKHSNPVLFWLAR